VILKIATELCHKLYKLFSRMCVSFSMQSKHGRASTMNTTASVTWSLPRTLPLQMILALEVQIRSKLIRFWSYIRSAAIRIGDDILEIEGSADPVLTEANNHYWINFEYEGELTTLGGFPAVKDHLKSKYHSKQWLSSKYPGKKKERWFEIDLSSKKYPGQKIVISTVIEFVRVDFENGSDESFGNSVGMLGDFRSGKTLGRDGVTELDDFSMLGNEWQVLLIHFNSCSY
jgi:hypothetical protein